MDNVRDIKSVGRVQGVTTPSGTDPKDMLPDQVDVTYSDDETGKANVTWEASTKDQYGKREGGTYTLTGTVAGTDLKATITVTVEPATVTGVKVDPTEVSVVKGTSLEGKLPATATVTWSNGETTTPNVSWNTDAVDTEKIGTYTATATVEGKSLSVKVNVVDATITSVTAPDPVTVASGTKADALGLPDTVKAALSNGKSTDVSVTWAALTEEQQAVLASKEGGTFTVHGTIDGFNAGVDITVNVKAATAKSATVSPDQVTTPSGTAPTLPAKAKVAWSNGQTTDEDVAWPELDASKYTNHNGTSFTVDGTVKGLKVTVTVNVAAASVSSVSPLPEVKTTAGTAPTMPETAHVTWTDGTQSDEKITWNLTKDDYAKRTDGKKIEGTILTGTTREFQVSTTLIVTAEISAVTNPAGVTTPSGTDPKDRLPSEVDVTYSDGDTGKAAVTWEASTKAQYGKREGGQYTLTGTVAGTDKKATITVTVEPATVKGVTGYPESLEIFQGESLDGKLPSKVTVVYSNGDDDPQPVTWNTDGVKVKEPGDYTATATVAGQPLSVAVKVVALVPVRPVSADLNIRINVGDELKLPDTLKVLWNNGKETNESVEWDEVPEDKLATPGTFDVAGTIYVGDKTPASSTGTAVSPRLRLVLRAATTPETRASFKVTAHVTVSAKAAQPGSGEVVQGGSSGTKNGTKASGVSGLARTGASVALLPFAVALGVAGVLVIRRRREA